MTEADILKQFVGVYDKSSFRDIPYNNLVMSSKDDIRDSIISLVANKILEASVDNATMEIVLTVKTSFNHFYLPLSNNCILPRQIPKSG
jgi:hypothetical protein